MQYHGITPQMTIGDLVMSGVYGAFADYIFTDMTPDHWYAPLESYGFEKVGFVQALHRMEELAGDDSHGAKYVYPIYDEETRRCEWDKAKPVFLHFPGPCEARPYVVIVPGGGFNRQWGLIEGMAIASEFNRLGYTAFVLYYRTKQEPVIDKALEDMYECIRRVEANAAHFRVLPGHYIIGGFSAGATLAGEIGSLNLGWKSAGVPKPEMVFLGYTAIRMRDNYDVWASYPAGHPAHIGTAAFLRRIGGPEFTQEKLAPYELAEHIDGTYPPLFLTANEDDPTVPFVNSRYFAETCQRMNIPCRTRFGRTGGHSYGLGIGLEVEGWMEDAIAFWKVNAQGQKSTLCRS